LELGNVSDRKTIVAKPAPAQVPARVPHPFPGWRTNRIAYVQAVLLTLLAVLAILPTAGCWGPGPIDLERRLQLARETIARQTDELAARQATIETLTREHDQQRAIKPEDLRKIFYPEKLEIESLSGGYDSDGRPGDDGVVVYLKPIDSAGDVLKVAGEIRIQLYDLAAPPAGNFLGEYVFPVEKTREMWYGKLMTYHYAVKCPWLHGPPQNPELTIRATFIDYLTQRVMSAQSVGKVRLPPRRTP
jgi:hypothetical protein